MTDHRSLECIIHKHNKRIGPFIGRERVYLIDG